MSKSFKMWELPYEIEDRFDKIDEIMNDPDFEGDREEAAQMLLDEIVALGEERDQKYEWLAMQISNKNAEAELLKAEEQRLAKRRRAAENRVKSMKSFLQQNMEMFGIEKKTAGIFKLSIQNNAESVVLDWSPEDLPTEYRRVTIEADKALIKEALKAGEVLDFAHLERTRSLRIK